jgi:hypothetical protein
MLRRVALVRTDVSEELTDSIIRVTRIGELGTTLSVTSNRLLRSVRRLLVTASVVPSSPILVTLMKEALSSFETSVLARATRRNIPEDNILHSHLRVNLNSYIVFRSFVSALWYEERIFAQIELAENYLHVIFNLIFSVNMSVPTVFPPSVPHFGINVQHDMAVVVRQGLCP